MVTTFYPPYHFGGDATYVRALARALVARGHAVEVVHCVDAYRLGARSESVDAAPEAGVVVHRLKSRLGPLSPFLTQQTGHPVLKLRALRAVLAQGFDVVHFHNISLVGGPAVLRLSRAPVTLYSLHEHWLMCPAHVLWQNRKRACERPACLTCSLRSGIPPQLWRYTSLTRRSIATVDLLLAPSEYTARRHREARFAPPVHVLPLFSALAPNDRPADTLSPARPRFLFVGRMTAAKGVEPLVQEFAALPDYDLHLVGDGDVRAPLERRFGNQPNIHFLGSVPQARLVALYRDASALILPSLAPETFGLSVIEAFACGTPAIVRDAGGAREIVDATGGGLVYRSAEELRSAVHRLAHDGALRQRLGACAREGYLRLYTEDEHLRRYLGHIESIRARKISPGHVEPCGRS